MPRKREVSANAATSRRSMMVISMDDIVPALKIMGDLRVGCASTKNSKDFWL
jgi:hypothetical protein